MTPGDGLPGQVWAIDVSAGHTALIVARFLSCPGIVGEVWG
jgi:hypothetical protein